MYFSKLKGLFNFEAKTSIDYWINKLELNDYKNKKLSELSKGNQQKVQLIVCFLNNPDIVILDEPFSGLDPVNSIILNNGKIIESDSIVNIKAKNRLNNIILGSMDNDKLEIY